MESLEKSFPGEKRFLFKFRGNENEIWVFQNLGEILQNIFLEKKKNFSKEIYLREKIHPDFGKPQNFILFSTGF